MRKTKVLIAWTAAFAPVPLQAEEPEVLVLQPSGSWQLDYAETRCRLARTFGRGDELTAFWIEQTGPGSSFRWLMAGGAAKKLGLRRGIEVRFGPGFDPVKVNDREGSVRGRRGVQRTEVTLEGFGEAIMGFGYRPPVLSPSGQPVEPPAIGLAPDDGAKIDHVQFVRGDREVRLATGSLKAGFKALNDCTRNLYASWGVTPEEIALATTRVKALNMQEVVQRLQQAYPAKAKTRGEQATMTLKILVTADGTVERCIRNEIAKAENFGDAPCEIIKEYARFEPARDATGKPVRGFYHTEVAYWIP